MAVFEDTNRVKSWLLKCVLSFSIFLYPQYKTTSKRSRASIRSHHLKIIFSYWEMLLSRLLRFGLAWLGLCIRFVNLVAQISQHKSFVPIFCVCLSLFCMCILFSFVFWYFAFCCFSALCFVYLIPNNWNEYSFHIYLSFFSLRCSFYVYDYRFSARDCND